MKISLGQIINNITYIQELMKLELPIELSFSIAKEMKKIDPDIQAYSQEKDKYIINHGTLNEAGAYTILAGTTEMEEFTIQMSKLLVKEVELNIIKIKKTDFAKVETLSADLLFALDWLIDLEG